MDLINLSYDLTFLFFLLCNTFPFCYSSELSFSFCSCFLISKALCVHENFQINQPKNPFFKSNSHFTAHAIQETQKDGKRKNVYKSERRTGKWQLLFCETKLFSCLQLFVKYFQRFTKPILISYFSVVCKEKNFVPFIFGPCLPK